MGGSPAVGRAGFRATQRVLQRRDAERFAEQSVELDTGERARSVRRGFDDVPELVGDGAVDGEARRGNRAEARGDGGCVERSRRARSRSSTSTYNGCR